MHVRACVCVRACASEPVCVHHITFIVFGYI